jgi:hypothetical protein
VWRALSRAGSRRWRAALGSGIAVLALRAVLLPVWPIPTPSVLDEFSYRLLGDTFASGRLANPPHPLWVHFETPLVLQQPTYASVFPAVQGLFLAAGTRMAGDPWWGVWLSAGIMCVAVGWAMQGWLPPRWALLGMVWVSLQLALTSYWMNSYWGGAASATGGALVIGAAARLRRRSNVRYAFVLAIGLAILANTRPYEGFLLGGAAAAWLGLRLVDKRVILPIGATLAVAGALMAVYFHSVTGSAFEMPTQAYIEQYAAAPAFVWQKLPPEPVYRHTVLRELNEAFLSDYHQYDTVWGAIRFSAAKLRLLGTFYLGPLVFVPVIALPCLFRGRSRFLIVATLITLGGVLLTVGVQPHYGAPLTAAFAILAMQALRYFRIARRFGNPLGEFLIPAAIGVCLIYIAFSATAATPITPLSARPGIVAFLEEHGSQHVVFVRYGEDHVPGDEWVYNDADIDRSRIVWARDMGTASNAEVLKYYPNRRAWLFLPDSNPAQLTPYQ